MKERVKVGKTSNTERRTPNIEWSRWIARSEFGVQSSEFNVSQTFISALDFGIWISNLGRQIDMRSLGQYQVAFSLASLPLQK